MSTEYLDIQQLQARGDAKRCTKCGDVKPVHEFYGRADHPSQRPECKHCTRTHVNAYRKANPDKARETWRKSGLKRYGLTLEQYDAMYEEQSGSCAICRTHQSELTTTMAVDHNHSSGRVRGLLCSECNQAIGKFRDNPERLESALNYLIRFDPPGGNAKEGG